MVLQEIVRCACACRGALPQLIVNARAIQIIDRRAVARSVHHHIGPVIQEARRLPASRPTCPPPQRVVAVADALPARQLRARHPPPSVPVVGRRPRGVTLQGCLPQIDEAITHCAQLGDAIGSIGGTGRPNLLRCEMWKGIKVIPLASHMFCRFPG